MGVGVHAFECVRLSEYPRVDRDGSLECISVVVGTGMEMTVPANDEYIAEFDTIAKAVLHSYEEVCVHLAQLQYH